MSNDGNPLKVKLFAPSFWRSMALLLSTIVHLASFIAVLVTGVYYYIPILNPLFWRVFFAIYCGIAVGIVGLGINQLRNFFSTFDREYAKKKDIEGYETTDLSVNSFQPEETSSVNQDSPHPNTGESGDTYNLEQSFFNHVMKTVPKNVKRWFEIGDDYYKETLAEKRP